MWPLSGGQEREGIDWDWVRASIGHELRRGDAPFQGLSSLARGADQVFAEEVLRLGGDLTAIIPIDRYETYFDGDTLSQAEGS